MAKYLDQTGLSHLKGRWNIDGIQATSSGIKRYATCNTAGSTSVKEATLSVGKIETLTQGTEIIVNFVNKNTKTDATLTLYDSIPSPNTHTFSNLPIKVNGGAITDPGILNGVVILVYDGTNLNVVGSGAVGPATDDYYGGFKTGYTTTSTNRAVQLDANGKAFVTIPAGTVDTWRPIKVDGDQILSSDITSNALDLVHGTNITLTNSSGAVTIATTAEVNQNAFSNVVVHPASGSDTTIAADTKTDTITFNEGTNITLTPDATNDKITIATTAEVNQNAFSNVEVGSTTIAANTKTDTLKITGGGSVTVSADASTDTITISGTNTTYSAGTALSLSGTTFNHANVYGGGTTPPSGQAVYPVTIDAQGHITSAGTARTDMTYSEAVAGTNTTGRFISAKVLNDTITNAIGQVTGFQFEVVASYADLPNPGSFGTIYLVPKALAGTCSTAAATAAKTATVSGSFTMDSGSIAVGTAVTITFSNTNTNNKPTLNVTDSATPTAHSSGAKYITVNGVPIDENHTSLAGLLTGTVSFIYNGTTWALVDEIDNSYNEYIWITTGSGTQSIEVNSTATSITWDELNSYEEYYNDAHGNYATDVSIDTLFEINTSATPNYIQTKSAINTYTEDTPSHSVCSEGNTWYAVDTTNHVVLLIELVDKDAMYAQNDILEARQLIIVNDPSQGKYEVIGTTDINLSRYWSKAELTSLSDTDIDNILDA